MMTTEGLIVAGHCDDPAIRATGVGALVSDLSGVTGRQKLAKIPLPRAYTQRVTSLLELIDVLDAHEARFSAAIAHELHKHAAIA